MATPSDADQPPYPENARYGCVNCGSINHTTGDTNWCPAERDEPRFDCPGGPAVRTDLAHHLGQCRCGIWFHTVMDDPTFPPHTATAEWVTFGVDAALRSDVLHGHAGTTTEHEVASPPTPGQPTGPAEQTDLQDEPAASPRPTTPVALVLCDNPDCSVAWAYRDPPADHYHPKPHGPERPDD